MTTYGIKHGDITLSSASRIFDQHDMSTMKKLASIGCSDYEIASILKTDVRSLAPYKSIMDEAKGELKATLRRAQFEKALVEKDSRMQIWLGKQYLGQTDKLEASTEHSIKPEIVIYDDAIKQDKADELDIT